MAYSQVSATDIPARHPVRVLHDFWWQVAGANRLAPWFAFDPVDHPRILPWIMLLHAEMQDGREILRYTVCGTGCTSVFGFSYQNKIFGEKLPPDAVKRRSEEFRRVRAGEGPILSRTRLPIEGRQHVEVYRGVFAFTADGRAAERVMVVLAPHDVKV